MATPHLMLTLTDMFLPVINLWSDARFGRQVRSQWALYRWCAFAVNAYRTLGVVCTALLTAGGGVQRGADTHFSTSSRLC